MVLPANSSVANLSGNPVSSGVISGKVEELDKALQNLNVNGGVRARFAALKLSNSTAGLLTRVFYAICGMSESVRKEIVANLEQKEPDQIMSQLNKIMPNLYLNLTQSTTIKELDVAVATAVTEVASAIAPAAIEQEDEVKTNIRDALQEIPEVKMRYDQQYEQINREKFHALQQKYHATTHQEIIAVQSNQLRSGLMDALVARNPRYQLVLILSALTVPLEKTRLSEEIWSNLASTCPDLPELRKRNEELMPIMRDFSRLVRYGNTHRTQNNRKENLANARNGDVFKYDPEEDKFVFPNLPEIAEFGTQLKRECDANFAALTENCKTLKTANEYGEKCMETEDEKTFAKLRAELWFLANNARKIDSILGYTGNSHSLETQIHQIVKQIEAHGSAKGWC
jgi:predicted transcriptional regulator